MKYKDPKPDPRPRDSSPVLGMGQVRFDRKVKLRVTWDPVNDSFIFQKGNDPEEILSYTVPDGSIPGTSFGGFKRLEVLQRVANCTDGPTTCGMDVFFDSVYINPQP